MLEGDALEQLEALGWEEAPLPGVPGRWWCAECVAKGPAIVVVSRGKRYRR